MTRVRQALLAAILLAAMLAVVALSVLALWSTRPVSEGDLARAAALAAADAERPILITAVEDCRERPVTYGLGTKEPSATACEAAVTPDPLWYLGRPPLDADAVAAYDALLLGLVLAALAGAAGLVLGGVDGWRLRQVIGRAAVLGTGLGTLGAAGLWIAVALALLLRGLDAPDAALLLQVVRTGLLAAGGCVLTAVATIRLNSAAWAVLLLGGVAVLTFWLPVDVLDVAEGWLTWDGL